MRIENQAANQAAAIKSQIGGMKSASGSDFQAQLVSTQKAAETHDTVSISGGSYEQRLENLKKLHEQTDYSGMSDLDKARLIESRFQEAFPDIHAMYGGLYLCAGKGSIYDKIIQENENQIKNIISQPFSHKTPMRWENTKYILGYDGLSDDEIRAKVNEKYSGGTLADRCGALHELDDMGLDDGAAPWMMIQIEQEMVQGTEGKYGRLSRENPLRVNAMIEYATGTKMNWTQLAQATMEFASNSTCKQLGLTDEEAKRQFLTELEPKLDKFLDQMLRTDLAKPVST